MDNVQPTTAVIYSSGFGSNAGDIGEYIAESLNADVFDLKKQTLINMQAYRRVIFGTGLQLGKPAAALVTFLEANQEQLQGKKLSLFVACSGAEDKCAKQCEKASEILGIADAVPFNGKAERNEQGFDTRVDGFIDGRRD
jgi:menaquinone-dependent protoporphyrinogen IX oxidase